MVFEHSVVKTKHICKETENSYSSASNSQTQSQVESSHSKVGPRWAVGVLLNVLLRRLSAADPRSKTRASSEPRRSSRDTDNGAAGRPIRIDRQRRRLHIGYVRGPSTDDYTEGRRGFCSRNHANKTANPPYVVLGHRRHAYCWKATEVNSGRFMCCPRCLLGVEILIWRMCVSRPF